MEGSATSTDTLDEPLRVGFIGAGKMAQAICRGFISSDIVKPEHMIASSPHQEKHVANEISKAGVHLSPDNVEVVKKSVVIILAVKPYQVLPVLAQVSSVLQPHTHLLVSVAAGVVLASIEQMIPTIRVMRVMPNISAMISLSATAICRGTLATERDAELTKSLFSSIGICEEVSEHLMNTVTALSAPAHALMMIDALSDGGVKMGLPRSLSTRFAAQSLLGASSLCLSPQAPHPAQLKDEVCSPGGCTISAVHELERNGFRAALISAVEVATRRCEEMGAENKKT